MSIGTRDAIIALSHATTGVAPTAEQVDAFAAEVGDDPARLRDLAGRMRVYADAIQRSRNGFVPDHSQYGEYPLLLKRLVRRGCRHGIIVDVGVLGRKGSNSYDLLATHGWRGLLIEANPHLVETIRFEFGPVDYELVSCAVGPETGRQTFYMSPSPGVSSLIEASARHFGELAGAIEVEVRRLGDILAEAAIPHDFDILDIDIEGMDVPVLNDLIAGSPYRPDIVVIEGSRFFQTGKPEDIGLSGQVCDTYVMTDRTISNLVLELR